MTSIHDVRTPLLTPEGERMLRGLQQHPDAPRFNYATGDRLHGEDLAGIEAFRESLAAPVARRAATPPPEMLERVLRWRQVVPFVRRRIPADLDLERAWDSVPTSSREDLALAPWEFVPDDAALDRLVIYRTAGTTGHPIAVPHHPVAIRCYEPLIERALARHGVRFAPSAGEVACFLVGAQVRTYTYAAVLYTWGGAGFAKLNLRQTDWPREGSQQRYFDAHAPRLLTGDPISFAEMMRSGIEASPVALVTTSVALSPGLRARLEARYRAPVVDWYSMVETGPIGFGCPKGRGYHLLSSDVFVEVLRKDGTVAAPLEHGEVTVTGGRNPFAPLLRYRTGDSGHVDDAPCACGDPMPRLVDLEGRRPVLLRASDGTPVTTVDLSRILREFPLMLHEMTQREDRACELVVRPLPDADVDTDRIEAALRRVLGDVPLSIQVDPRLGERDGGKVLPYKSELMLED